jgi:hypothetical protein
MPIVSDSTGAPAGKDTGFAAGTDARISAASTYWRCERMNPSDRDLRRLGACQPAYRTKTPSAVAAALSPRSNELVRRSHELRGMRQCLQRYDRCQPMPRKVEYSAGVSASWDLAGRQLSGKPDTSARDSPEKNRTRGRQSWLTLSPRRGLVRSMVPWRDGGTSVRWLRDSRLDVARRRADQRPSPTMREPRLAPERNAGSIKVTTKGD